MEPFENLDGWLLVDVVALLIRLGQPSTVPATVPVKNPEPHESENEHFFGFCDVCGHMHEFCQCDDREE